MYPQTVVLLGIGGRVVIYVGDIGVRGGQEGFVNVGTGPPQDGAK